MNWSRATRMAVPLTLLCIGTLLRSWNQPVTAGAKKAPPQTTMRLLDKEC